MPNRIDTRTTPQDELHEHARYEHPAATTEPWRPDPHPEGGRRDELPVPLRQIERAPSFRGYGPASYRRSDARILEDVCDRLTEDDVVDARQVEVRVVDGVVVLTGRVPARSMKYRAEEVVETVLGVAEVDNQLRVSRGQPAMREHRGD
jgi:hypothetical protein